MAKKQFKAESKRLLDLMINSIYTHKEIFLRELISNASDAVDKLYFRSLTDDSVKMNRDEFAIRIIPDKDSRTLIISDNGCGMTREELESNLGTIAKSGTLSFKKENETGDDMEIIGQFGVGFYSAFMVSSDVKVISRAFGSDEAYLWQSAGTDGYTVTPCEKDTFGTDVILTIKDDEEGEEYSRFLSAYTLSSLVKKYSDYIRYPIHMDMEKSRPVEGKQGEYEDYTEDEILNSMIPVWKKNKSELTDEDYNSFYQEKFHDYDEPILRMHTSTEGMLSYNALLFVPKKPPFDFYSKDYKRGLQLYANGVMIMDKCEDLLPDYFGFVKGLVDSGDLSLNISREMLQHDRQLKAIAQNLKKKIKSELVKLLENDREKYEEFFKSFGLTLKYGLYSGYGMNTEFLSELILFRSAAEDKLITLKEYTERMSTDQKYIYYACADSAQRAMKLPQTELVREKGYDILLFTDDVDEFAVKMMNKFMDKEFRSVSDNDLDIATDEQKEDAKKKQEEHSALLDEMKTALDGLVKSVVLSSRLKTSAVCLTSDGPMSIEMEKVLSSMPVSDGSMKAERVLELNPAHPVFTALCALTPGDERIARYARLLYDQALLIEGLPIEDPVEFSNSVCELMK